MRFFTYTASLSLLLAVGGCDASTSSKINRACTVTQNADGSATIECPDGTTATIAAGKAGKDGTPCTASDNEDGSHTIACADGTSVVVGDGVDGTSCAVSDNGDGTSTLSCNDGTAAIVPTGASCTVVDNHDGTKTVSCSDGTSTTVASIVWEATSVPIPVSSPSGDPTGIQFFDSLNGYCLWQLERNLLVTQDAGVSWTKKTIGSTPSELRAPLGMHFLSPMEGWVVGIAQVGGAILHTKDGGDSWTPEFLADGSPGDTALTSVFAWDSLHAWAIGETPGRILGTVDGGLTWSVQNTAEGAHLRCAAFKSESEGWSGGPGGIWHTSNGGTTWSQQYTKSVDKLSLLDGGEIIAITGDGMIKSSDGGASWPLVHPVVIGSGFRFNDAFFVGQSYGWAVGCPASTIVAGARQLFLPVAVAG